MFVRVDLRDFPILLPISRIILVIASSAGASAKLEANRLIRCIMSWQALPNVTRLGRLASESLYSSGSGARYAIMVSGAC